MHQTYGDVRIGNRSYGTRRAQRGHIIDHAGTGRYRRAHQLRLAGIDRDGNAEFGMDTFDHGQHPRHLLVQRYRSCPRTRRFTTDIEDIGTLGQHAFCLPQGVVECRQSVRHRRTNPV